jgi:UDP-N-acetylglucosamine 2-epimerase (non-hydrolysing)/GDP/UDP-N,N'-diacetylbacillosamine 2-epimerase (hydrolysing)
MPERKICVVTGSRAEYGLLSRVMQGIKDDPNLEIQIIVTGMHLSPEFGLTYRVIEEDGFQINAKVEMLLSSDTAVGVAKSIGLGLIGFAEALDRLQPDILVLLGDRFEILAAAEAALIARIPIAHIGGGDTTEGSFDESIRHSISKMSHLHFVTNDVAARRVRQLGENPAHIYNVGSPGIDQIKRLKLLDREEIESILGVKFKKKNLLITFHPVTLDFQTTAEQFQQLLDVLSQLGAEVGLIFTKPNSDPEGRVIIRMIDDYVAKYSNASSYISMGQLLYLSTIAQVDVVIGNSSSGLYEVPSFKKPTVNIGDRQKGRLQAASVINCMPQFEDIQRAILTALKTDCSGTVNPYGDGNSSLKILEKIKQISSPQALIKKRFFDFP